MRRTVLTAVVDVLIAEGMQGLTVASVAETAGVSRSTIYRRWPTAGSLVSAAVQAVTDDALPVPDTGNLRADLRTLARSVVDMLSDPRSGALVRALVAGTADEQIERVAVDYWTRRAELARGRVQTAVQSGELPPHVGAEQVIESIAAPILFRFLVVRRRLHHRDADAAVDNFLRSVADR